MDSSNGNAVNERGNETLIDTNEHEGRRQQRRGASDEGRETGLSLILT